MPVAPYLAACRNPLTRSGAAPFTPLSLSPLCWLDASQLGGLSNGDPVSTFTDATGNGRSPTASTTARPTYTTGALNGLPVLAFNGTTNKMLWASAFVTLPFTAFIVCKRTGTGSGGPMEWVANGDLILAGQSASAAQWGVYNGSGWQAASYSCGDQYRVIEYVRSSTSNYILGTDGNFETKTNGGTPLGLTQAVLGSDEYGQILAGSIAEFLVFSGAMSTDNRTLTRNYLGSKYGITLA